MHSHDLHDSIMWMSSDDLKLSEANSFESVINKIKLVDSFRAHLIGQNFSITTTFLQHFLFAVLSISPLSRLTFVDSLLNTVDYTRSHHWVLVICARLAHRSSFLRRYVASNIKKFTLCD